MQIPTVGIVAEYNPFHNGHKYHMEQARRLSGAEAVIIVLSSNFVQRGEPALLNKRSRAENALEMGADLVIELPVVFSAHNAGVFASAATDILGHTGLTTHMSFGVESPHWKTDEAINILIEEPKPFKAFLKEYLKEGRSFAEARAMALDALLPGSSEKLKGSNNLLALSYLMRNKVMNWNMKAVPVKRVGPAYNDTRLTCAASASGIRNALANGKTQEAFKHLPKASARLLKTEMDKGRACIDRNLFWNILRCTFLRRPAETLTMYAEFNEGIEYRLKNAAQISSSYGEWTERCASKRYPKSRIKRHAIHALLGLDHWENRAFQRLGPAYIRVLAMNSTGRALMRQMKEKATLPLITRCGDASRISGYAKKIMDYEILAAELWESCISGSNPGSEAASRIIIR